MLLDVPRLSAAPSLDGAQAQIQGGFVVGAEQRGWKVISVTSGGDAQKQINDVNDFIYAFN